MRKWLQHNQVLIIVLICVLSRLPQLISHVIVLDGDECIEGLMAKHFYEFKTIPLFFYGQAYGFSFVEVLFISAFYLITGVSAIAVKISMLCLWTIGIVYFFKTLKLIKPEDKWLAFAITLVFIFAPSWALWSTKARGGYLTSFALFPIITYLLFNKNICNKAAINFLIGFLTVIVYEAQPLWLAGLLPVFVYHYYLKKTKPLLMFFLGLISTVVLFIGIKFNISTFWSPHVVSFSNINTETFLSIPKQVYNNLTGSYYYNHVLPSGLLTRIWAIAFEVCIFVMIGTSIVFAFLKKKTNPYLYVFSISLTFSIGYIILLNEEAQRYLLPLTGFALLFFYFIFDIFKNNIFSKIVLAFFILIGSISILQLKLEDKEPTVKTELANLIEVLESKNINHIYCKDGLLQWQIMFYSNEKIIARCYSNIDRYPAYISEVDKALESNKNAALVKYYPQGAVCNSTDSINVCNKYLIQVNPSKELLKANNFEME